MRSNAKMVWMVRIRFPRALALFLTVFAGCDSLLDVDPDPHTVDASQRFGLQQAIVGATADLFQSYDSGIVWGGLFSDEFVSSGTAPGIHAFDRRDVPADHGGGDDRGRTIGGGFYVPLQRAVAAADLLQERILDGGFEEITSNPADSPEYARGQHVLGIREDVAGRYLLHPGVRRGRSRTELRRRVPPRGGGAHPGDFEAANAEPDVLLQAALVGRARVRLILGDEAGALADARLVAPDFELLATYSSNTFEQRNRDSLPHLGFRQLECRPAISRPDDRRYRDLGPASRTRAEPAARRSSHRRISMYPLKVPSPSSPLRIATGDEAQYIIAEIVGGAKRQSRSSTMYGRGKGSTSSGVPWGGGDPNEIRDKIIDERKRTLFPRRRAARRHPALSLTEYGLNFFPTSTPQGFPMGDQTCLPMPEIERNNNPGV